MSNHYVKNADFFKGMVDHKKKVDEAKQNGTPLPKIPDYLATCLVLIAKNLSNKPNFYSYTFKEEMIGDAIENCILYFNNFDPSKSNNPFAYFTQIIYYAFLRRIAREKKQLYVKYKSYEKFGGLDDAERDELEENGINTAQFEMYENISEFIETYELTVKKNKDKNAKPSKKTKLELLFDEGEEVIEIDETIGIIPQL